MPTLRVAPTNSTAPGVSIYSANNDGNVGSNNCNTRSMSGTSMAAPAGLAALVGQYSCFRDCALGSGARRLRSSL